MHRIKRNVIPVYDNSYYFQSFVSQGLKSYQDKSLDLYFFVADDVALNSIIDQESYSDIFNIDSNDCFHPGFNIIGKEYWKWSIKAVKFNPFQPGINIKNELPDKKEANLLINKFGSDIIDIPYNILYYDDSTGVVKSIYRKYRYRRKSYKLKYPLVRGYSDIFIVSKKTLLSFAHFYGIFASLNLFVEIAIPTSFALSAHSIKTMNDTHYKNGDMWNGEELDLFNSFHGKLGDLLEFFPKDILFYHPIKLSSWQV